MAKFSEFTVGLATGVVIGALEEVLPKPAAKCVDKFAEKLLDSPMISEGGVSFRISRAATRKVAAVAKPILLAL